MKRAPAKPKPSKKSQADALPALPSPPAETLLGPSLLIPVYLFIVLLGYLAFQSGKATVAGNEFSTQRSLFAAVNAATLTGFSQSVTVNDYTPVGRALTITLIIAGTLFTLITASLAVVKIAKLPYTTRKVIAWAIGSIIITMSIGSLFSLRDGPAAIFNSISAFANSGLYRGTPPNQFNTTTHFVLLPLAVLGGIGLPVLMELWDWLRRDRPLSLHSQTALNSTALAFLISTIFLLALQFPGLNASTETWRHTLETASAQAINSRSAGFPFDFAKAWPRAVQWFVIVLMVIGANPAGTAGGLKLTTLATINTGIRATLNRHSPGRPFAIALIWTAIYLALLFISLIALLITAPQISPDQILFLAASALGNVGLSHDTLALSDSALTILSITMLLGRITPIFILWWTAETTPEATIAIG